MTAWTTRLKSPVRITEPGRPIDVSFEFSPPKTPEAEEALWRTVRRLAPLGPRFVSVTYGAGGSTRERTYATVRRIRTELGIDSAAHLTCVGATKAELCEIAQGYWDSGIRHIVALRGDPPAGAGRYAQHPDGCRDAAELIALLRDVADFEISVAAYPEVHPDAVSADADLDNLKRKIDAGATRAITQFFFYNDIFLRFVDRAMAAGITVPIVPGIIPVSNFVQIRRMAAMCGTAVPSWMADMFEGLEDDLETRRLLAATIAADQCRELAAFGVEQFHFYTLNRADLSFALCHMLGLRPKASQAETLAAHAHETSALGGAQ